MKRVTGIGGVFFKCKDSEAQKLWYEKHLGIPASQYGFSFQWNKNEGSDSPGHTAWSPFKTDTKYFEPSQKDFMFNYRVDDLDALLKVLKEEGVEIVGEPESFEYGKFAWIMDPEGNKIELWQPFDEVYAKML
ncbi:MAG: putative enzyme related to lactoylglutathione lyase [Limisphaerales bacterium]|jgi:predicted enzyme related to lactoylglutathione lyase